MMDRKEQIALAKNAKSVEELMKIAEENGVKLTEEDAEALFARLHTEGEISEDELENVAGGNCLEDLAGPSFIDVSLNPYYNKYYCPDCDGTFLECCSTYLSTTYGAVDVYHCPKCDRWFWHYTDGEYAGRWRYRPC